MRSISRFLLAAAAYAVARGAQAWADGAPSEVRRILADTAPADEPHDDHSGGAHEDDHATGGHDDHATASVQL